MDPLGGVARLEGHKLFFVVFFGGGGCGLWGLVCVLGARTVYGFGFGFGGLLKEEEMAHQPTPPPTQPLSNNQSIQSHQTKQSP